MAVVKKELVKHAKALNKLELTEDPIDVKGDVEDIQEEFISAIEEIDDDGKIGEVPDKTIDYYESLIDDGDGGGGGGDEDLEEMDEDELAEFMEEKGLKIKGWKKMDEDELREAIQEALEESGGDDDSGETPDLEEMDEDELIDFIKEKKLKIKGYKKMDEDELREAIEEAMGGDDGGKKSKKSKKSKKGKADKKGKAKKDKKSKKGKKAKGEKKGKKEKKSKKSKGGDYPKGVRTGTLPAALYDAVKGGATWKDLAKVVGDEKDKEPEKCYGVALRNISRKLSKAVPIKAVFNGEDATAEFSLAEEEDDD